MHTITIDTDVPLPTDRQQFGNNVKYPIADLEVGHSFWVAPTENRTAGGMAKLVRSAILAHKKRPGNEAKKFTTRVRSKKGQPGVRVWRIE